MSSSNPLLKKWEEIHGKKEKPKVIKAENAKIEFEGEVTLAQVENAFKKWSSNTSIKGNQIGYTYIDEISVASNLTSPSVATSNTGITKASNFLTHDIHDTEKTFLQVADKIKQGKAKVGSVSMEHDVMLMGGTKVFFEVYLR
jgi:hypothetical protein